MAPPSSATLVHADHRRDARRTASSRLKRRASASTATRVHSKPTHAASRTTEEGVEEGSNHSEVGSNHSEEGFNHSEEGFNHSEEGSNHSEEGSNHSEEGFNHSEVGFNHSEEGSNHSEEGFNHSEVGFNHSEVGFNHSEEGSNHSEEGSNHSEEGSNHSEEGSNHWRGGFQPQRVSFEERRVLTCGVAVHDRGRHRQGAMFTIRSLCRRLPRRQRPAVRSECRSSTTRASCTTGSPGWYLRPAHEVPVVLTRERDFDVKVYAASQRSRISVGSWLDASAMSSTGRHRFTPAKTARTIFSAFRASVPRCVETRRMSSPRSNGDAGSSRWCMQGATRGAKRAWKNQDACAAPRHH